MREKNKKKDSIKSFKGLNYYLKQIPIEILKSFSIQMTARYPELNNLELINDLEQNNKVKYFGELSKVLKSLMIQNQIIS